MNAGSFWTLNILGTDVQWWGMFRHMVGNPFWKVREKCVICNEALMPNDVFSRRDFSKTVIFIITQ